MVQTLGETHYGLLPVYLELCPSVVTRAEGTRIHSMAQDHKSDMAHERFEPRSVSLAQNCSQLS